MLIIVQTELEQNLAAANAKAQSLEATHATQAAEASAASLEELDRVQAELTTAQQELERLKTAQATTAGLDPASKEQVEAAIAERREQLEAEVAAKLKQGEDRVEARTNQMKTKLNDKIKEERQANEAKIVALRQETEEQIATLKKEHEAELTKIKSEPATAPAASDVPTTNGTAASKPYQPTDDEIRDLMKTNALVRKAVDGNVKKRVEEEIAKVREKKKRQSSEATVKGIN